jgi:hypothetical protein
MFAGKSFGTGGDGCAPDGAGSFIAGSGGSSGMAGTTGRLSFASAVAEGDFVVGGADVAAAGAEDVGCGVVGAVVDGHAGALVSAANDVPLVPFNGGTPSGD